MRKTGVGIIGCGAISGIYIQNSFRLHNLNLVGLADMDSARATSKIEEIKSKYAEWKAPGAPAEPELPVACTVEELLANKDIDIVLNLTVPKAHASVALAALDAGKHTYHEKPFALTRDDGKRILEKAKTKNLRVGCAPDTFLGAGLQTCRKIIDDGWIGKPIGATAFMTCPGHESWHPDPEFYYEVGGGPMLDMGPYYLTAMIHLMGPIKRVVSMARATYPTRTITSSKKYGKVIPVETPTHISSSLEFASGAIGTLMMSFDVYGAHLPNLEIFGTSGSLQCPDPNTFGNAINLKVLRNEWTPMPYSHGYKENARGIGLSDMAAGIAKNRPHRASGDLAFHVLDVMLACPESAESGKSVTIGSTVERPAAMPLALRDGEID